MPYALIKVSWVAGSLAGVLPVGDGFGMDYGGPIP